MRPCTRLYLFKQEHLINQILNIKYPFGFNLLRGILCFCCLYLIPILEAKQPEFPKNWHWTTMLFIWNKVANFFKARFLSLLFFREEWVEYLQLRSACDLLLYVCGKLVAMYNSLHSVPTTVYKTQGRSVFQRNRLQARTISLTDKLLWISENSCYQMSTFAGTRGRDDVN